jgi:hypothetical protein
MIDRGAAHSSGAWNTTSAAVAGAMTAWYVAMAKAESMASADTQ